MLKSQLLPTWLSSQPRHFQDINQLVGSRRRQQKRKDREIINIINNNPQQLRQDFPATAEVVEKASLKRIKVNNRRDNQGDRKEASEVEKVLSKEDMSTDGSSMLHPIVTIDINNHSEDIHIPWMGHRTTFIPSSSHTTNGCIGGANGFLHEIDALARRCLLAEHYAFCLAMKDVEQCQDYLIEERGQQDLLTITTTRYQQRSSTRLTNESNNSDVAHWFIPQVRLQEPRILRTSIYETFLNHFQQFHNEQDALGLVSLVLFPCFASDIVRETNFWMKSTTNASESEQEKEKLSIIASRTSIGTEGAFEHYSQFFETFSDALLVYEKTTIKSTVARCPSTNEEKTMTIVTTPFSYFLSLVLPVDSTTGKICLSTSPLSSSSSSSSTSSNSKSDHIVSSNSSINSVYSGDTTSISSLSCNSDSLKSSISSFSSSYPNQSKFSNNNSCGSKRGRDLLLMEEDMLSSSSEEGQTECKPSPINETKRYTTSPYPSTLPSPFHSPLCSTSSSYNRNDVTFSPSSIVVYLEFTGYNILTFNQENHIVKGVDHVHLSYCSKPELTLQDLLSYAGYHVDSNTK